MPRFIGPDETSTIHADWWEAGEHVVIRKFSYGDRQALVLGAAKYGLARTEDGGYEFTDVQLGFMNMEILNRGIKSWTLKDGRGKVPVLNRQNIERLSEQDAEYILEQINEFNPTRSAEEQDNFRDRPGDGTEE